MKIENVVKVPKLRINFRLINEELELSNYIVRKEIDLIDKYKKESKIISNNPLPVLAMEWNKSDSKIGSVNLRYNIHLFHSTHY